MHTATKSEFIKHYSEAIARDSAALFLGAGFSQPAGFVNWRELLRSIAEDLQLDIDRENDLIAIAQYHLNMKRSRSRLNEVLIHEFTKSSRHSPNHDILARLPIKTYWTTNYDNLIEDALSDAGRRVDVKVSHESLASTIRDPDATVYKMHGDVKEAHRAVITRDDYERYEITHALFSEKLKGDLISKTFCFIGFSFNDPNIEHILRRIRAILGENQRPHFCILRTPSAPKSKGGKALADYEYQKRLLQLRISDLQRFAIQTVLINDYSEITELLQEISLRANLRNVFVSGSSADCGDFGNERMHQLCRGLGREIINSGFNLVSGFGKGIAEPVIIGALEALYRTEKGHEQNRLILRPFPRVGSGKKAQAELDEAHRSDLISRSGSVIYVCGNRAEGEVIVEATGVWREFEIATALGRSPIPIGVTGFTARRIYSEVSENIREYYNRKRVGSFLRVLGNQSATIDELIKASMEMVKVNAVN